MKKIIGLILSIIFLLPIACNRTSELTFMDFDKDGNNEISKEEFTNVFTANFYDDWNKNDDEYLDDEDFYLTVFEIWDEDNDKLLSKEEWLYGYDYYYGDYIITDYDAIDADGDGYVEYAEYASVLDDTDFYLEWDLDASEYLSDKELAEGVFNHWDINKNGTLELNEYSNFDMYYLDI
jgi:Ca2+-binding EF-hand superfamily protein